MQEVNPGTVISFQSFENVFCRAFLAPAAASKAFPFLLPVICIDACHMRTKEGGMIFFATSVSGESHIVPLATAVASTKNEDN